MKSVFFFLILISSFTFAEEVRVVDVRRNITLSDTDKVYKDFYISGGSEIGMKNGSLLLATRKVNIRDASGSTNIGEITIPVGELKVIAVYDKVTVARQVKLLERDELPMLEQRGIMTGDLIEVKK